MLALRSFLAAALSCFSSLLAAARLSRWLCLRSIFFSVRVRGGQLCRVQSLVGTGAQSGLGSRIVFLPLPSA
ncbi:uncharacterized protein BDZ83DRAFT_603875 [Colletotrichum acutatum]|uniref:Secreted protein n=1 Tax=Glomerella acutata TaxID=27357 RepID=A0AAD8XLZ7_GLOAC|nr:uncharacterized protein BDZ83DRAFT_603875 [Colletotrichum acutatum]KAK1729890.1 hypothetical protein BDZ83DRAFT_603875 [Colletotrichum acutatum]